MTFRAAGSGWSDADSRPGEAGELLRERYTLFVCQRSLVQPRHHCRPVGTASERLQAGEQGRETPPSPFVRLAVAFDEALRPRQLQREVMVRRGKPLDPAEPVLDPGVLLDVAQRSPPPALEPAQRVQEEKACHRARAYPLASRHPSEPS